MLRASAPMNLVLLVLFLVLISLIFSINTNEAGSRDFLLEDSVASVVWQQLLVLHSGMIPR